MKLSIAFTLVILLGAAGLCWRNHERLAAAREEHHTLAKSVAAREFRPPGYDGRQGRSRRHEEEAQSAGPVAIAASLISHFSERETTRDAERENDDVRMMELADLISSLPPREWQDLLAEIRSADLTIANRWSIIELVLAAFSSADPRATFELAMTLPELLADKSARDAHLPSLLQAWAAEDPRAALAWYRSRRGRDNGIDDAAACKILVQAAGAKAPVLAFKLIDDLDILGKEDALAEVIEISAPAMNSRNATLAALRGYLAAIADENRRYLFSSVGYPAFGKVVGGDGAGTGIAWLEKAGLSEDELVAILPGLPARIAIAETPVWLEWIGRSIPPERSGRTVRGLVKNWTTADFRRAGEWVSGLPESPLKYASVAGYAETVARYEPDTAEAWALTLPEGTLRKEALGAVCFSMASSDRAAARAFAERHGIESRW